MRGIKQSGEVVNSVKGGGVWPLDPIYDHVDVKTSDAHRGDLNLGGNIHLVCNHFLQVITECLGAYFFFWQL